MSMISRLRKINPHPRRLIPKVYHLIRMENLIAHNLVNN